MQTSPLCKRCLLEELLEEQSLYEVIRQRIALLTDEERTGETEYRRRLALCQGCAELSRGTCAQCGCYVEIRAAKRRMRCPHISPKW